VEQNWSIFRDGNLFGWMSLQGSGTVKFLLYSPSETRMRKAKLSEEFAP